MDGQHIGVEVELTCRAATPAFNAGMFGDRFEKIFWHGENGRSFMVMQVESRNQVAGTDYDPTCDVMIDCWISPPPRDRRAAPSEDLAITCIRRF